MVRKVTDVTGMDFVDVTAQEGATLFDLWSPACAPCAALSPILDDLARDFADDLRICKANVAADTALGEHFSVRSLPTLSLYRDGAEVDRVIGFRSRAQLTAWIESLL